MVGVVIRFQGLLGPLVRQARQTCGLSLMTVAAQIPLDASELARAERNQVSLDYAVVCRLAVILADPRLLAIAEELVRGEMGRHAA